MIKAIKIEKRNIEELSPADYNPRKILRRGDKGYEKLKASLIEFGEVLPIVWNKQTGNIVGGHQRYFMYLDEGRKSLEVSVVDIPLEKEKALNITLNNEKVGSEWDTDKLAAIVSELNTPDLQLTGFDEEDLDSLIEGLDEINNLEINTDDFEEETPAPQSLNEEEKEGGSPLEAQNFGEPIVLPSKDDDEEKPPSEVYFKIGKIDFTVELNIYNTWLQEIKSTHGEDYDSIVEEILIRLGL